MMKNSVTIKNLKTGRSFTASEAAWFESYRNSVDRAGKPLFELKSKLSERGKKREAALNEGAEGKKKEPAGSADTEGQEGGGESEGSGEESQGSDEGSEGADENTGSSDTEGDNESEDDKKSED